jgi:tRNA dimethylallyltransferase
MLPATDKYLIVITGPTAVGKTQLAVDLAIKLQTEIISADSRQFFRELKIGTAVPSDQALSCVKHHFIGNLSIHDHFNVSDFEVQALSVIENLFVTNKYAIVAGGSGMYIDALCSGIDDFPDTDPMLRISLEKAYNEYGISYLRNQLKLLDPEYYRQVDAANHKRLLRALEVCMTTGKTYSSLRLNTIRKRPFHIIKIGLNLPRNELFERIGKRVDQMMAEGLEAEARMLYPQRSLNALNTVGYKELFNYFDGDDTLERAVENIKTNTRRYAKRQLTWLARDKSIQWFAPEQFTEIESFIHCNS